MADIDYFDSRVLTGVINKRPVRHDIFGNMFRRQAPRATELFELHVYSRGVRSRVRCGHRRRQAPPRPTRPDIEGRTGGTVSHCCHDADGAGRTR